MTIRPADPSDAAALARVHLESWRGAYPGVLPESVFAQLRPEHFEARWRDRLATDPENTFVCEIDGRPAGFATIGPSRDDAEVATVGELYGLYVHPACWRAGAGRALWARAREAMRAYGFAEAMLWVLEANARARRFYEAVGFTLAPDSRKLLHLYGVAVPEVQYRQILPPHADV